MTTKEPVWRDPYITWEELPLTLGTAHQGFFYPDPMGFFAEIRRWAVELFRLVEPRWTAPDALALTTLVHASRGKEHLANAIEAFQPRVILFLDEPSWQASGLEVDQIAHYIRDPHRPKQVYEGFWGVTESGMVVGKSPQHPTTHNLYRAEDLNGFLRSAPLRPPPVPPDLDRQAGPEDRPQQPHDHVLVGGVRRVDPVVLVGVEVGHHREVGVGRQAEPGVGPEPVLTDLGDHRRQPGQRRREGLDVGRRRPGRPAEDGDVAQHETTVPGRDDSPTGYRLTARAAP